MANVEKIESKGGKVEHYNLAHAKKTKTHGYKPKTKGDATYCTVCGFDESLHEIGKGLSDGSTYDHKTGVWS